MALTCSICSGPRRFVSYNNPRCPTCSTVLDRDCGCTHAHDCPQFVAPPAPSPELRIRVGQRGEPVIYESKCERCQAPDTDGYYVTEINPDAEREDAPPTQTSLQSLCPPCRDNLDQDPLVVNVETA